jgi:hypothetical protein
MKTMITTGIILCFLGLMSGIAQNTMNITYADGKKQAVKLDQPSCNIETIQFSKKDAVVVNTESKEYTDDKGNKVVLPCGKLAFTDKVVKFTAGTPGATNPIYKNPNTILGEPDYDYNKATSITLGCGGSIIVEFTSIWLVDVKGPDLHIFECGPAMEATQLEISKDGKTWVNIGKIQGGKASVDIGNFVSTGDQFRFVKLTDLKVDCGGATPGADIDAVAAIGCILKN